MALQRKRPRRRPIFPRGCPLSIFGAGELNFRVRDGNGCGLSARVTRISCVCSSDDVIGAAGDAWRRKYVSQNSTPAVRCVATLRRDDTVKSSEPSWQLPLDGLLKKVKPSTISTAQLHSLPSFHMPPIKQVFSLRSYPVNPVGNLISRLASHLDAFSAYPNRT